VRYIPANRGQLDAHGGGVWAVSDLSQTVVNDRMAILNAREPRLSAGGQIAIRHPVTGNLRIDDAWELGPCEDSRWSSETLAWWLGGRVWGRIVTDQPTQVLRIPGRAMSHPAPFWHAVAGRLWVALEIGGGELALCEWHDLAAGLSVGHPLGRSDGAGFDIDCAPGAEPHEIRVCYFDPVGKPVYRVVDTRQPLVSLAPEPEPEPLPDEPFVVDPTGVVEDVAAWLFSPNQGPDVHLSPDGRVRFFCKSDELSGDGPEPQIGEWWSLDDKYIGHLEDSSMGRRIYQGKPVSAETIVKLFPDTHAAVWASLPLYRNWWADDARVWLPQRCTSGYSLKYTTDFSFNTGEVHPNVLIEIRVDVGHGVINGKPVRVRGAYISSPDNGRTWNAEVNYYGPPDGHNAWIAGPFAAPPEGW
jgi:hypothetical protein